MKRSQLPQFLKSIHRGLWVRRPSNRGEHIYFGGLDGVYFYTRFIGSVPPGNIYRQTHRNYVNKDNTRHRSLEGLMQRFIEKKVLRRNYDKAIRRFLTRG